MTTRSWTSSSPCGSRSSRTRRNWRPPVRSSKTPKQSRRPLRRTSRLRSLKWMPCSARSATRRTNWRPGRPSCGLPQMRPLRRSPPPSGSWPHRLPTCPASPVSCGPCLAGIICHPCLAAGSTPSPERPTTIRESTSRPPAAPVFWPPRAAW